MLLQALAPLAAAPLAGAGAAAVAVALALLLRPRQHTPQIMAASTKLNSAVLALCPSLTAPYSLPAGEPPGIKRKGRVVQVAGQARRGGPCTATGSIDWQIWVWSDVTGDGTTPESRRCPLSCHPLQCSTTRMLRPSSQHCSGNSLHSLVWLAQNGLPKHPGGGMIQMGRHLGIPQAACSTATGCQ